MQYICKTKDRLAVIPQELCTRAEACDILGLKHYRSALHPYHQRGLRFAYVIHNGRRKTVYIRQEVLRYRYPTIPQDRITTAAVVATINKTFKTKYTCSRASFILRNRGLKPIKFVSPQPQLAWPRQQAITTLSNHAKNKLKKASNNK